MMQSQRKADKLQTKRFRNGSFSIRFKAVLENAFRRYNVMHSPAIFVVAGRLLRIVALKETAIVQKVSLRFIVATCQKISSFSSGPLPPPKPQSWIQKSSRTHRDNFGQRETKGKKTVGNGPHSTRRIATLVVKGGFKKRRDPKCQNFRLSADLSCHVSMPVHDHKAKFIKPSKRVSEQGSEKRGKV